MRAKRQLTATKSPVCPTEPRRSKRSVLFSGVVIYRAPPFGMSAPAGNAFIGWPPISPGTSTTPAGKALKPPSANLLGIGSGRHRPKHVGKEDLFHLGHSRSLSGPSGRRSSP